MVRLIVGLVLILVAFAELFLFISGPENKLVADVMTSVICQPGEKIAEVKGGYVYNSDGSRGQSINFYCQSEAGNKRDVTGSGVLLGILGYIIPFLSGLVLAILGPIAMARTQRKAARVVGFSTGNVSSTTDPFGKPININDFQTSDTHTSTVLMMNGKQVNLGDLSLEMAQWVQDAMGWFDSMGENGNFVIQGGDLSDKLAQLKEAYDKNLITQEEYERMRKAILDQMR